MKNGPKNTQDLVDLINRCISNHNKLLDLIYGVYSEDYREYFPDFYLEQRKAIDELAKALTVRLPEIHVQEAVHRILYHNLYLNEPQKAIFESFCKDLYSGLQELKTKYFGKVYKDFRLAKVS